MSPGRELTIIRLNRAAYAALLLFYPSDLRHKFATEMADVFEALLRDAIAERGPAGMISPWRSALWELLTVAAPLRLASNAVMAGAVAFLTSSALVLFFFRAVT